jgi:lipopolysaccharide transport system ATP-binding protein
VDEALGVGDEAFQRKCYAHLQKLRACGTTLLFVSHDAGTVVNLCNRAILLDHGRAVRIDTPKVVVTHYHQLIYAPAGVATHEPTIARDAPVQATSSPLSELATQVTDESFFDPALHPANPLTYSNRGAFIEKVTLLNLRGEKVNHLSHGCRYRISVDIRCEKTCVGVFFGSMISTIKGAAVSGFNTPHRDTPIPFLEAGQLLRWSYDFTCRLFADTYVVELGIGGRHGEDPLAFIHRVEDAYLFKVLPSQHIPINGLVNLDQAPRIDWC